MRSSTISEELDRRQNLNLQRRPKELCYCSACGDTGSTKRDDADCTSRKNILEMIELFSINKVRFLRK